MALPDQFFTAGNILVFGSAVVAIKVVTIVLYHLFNLKPKWPAFVLALIIAFIMVYTADERAWYDWVIGFVNACLLYCTALGLNEIGRETFSRSRLFTTWK